MLDCALVQRVAPYVRSDALPELREHNDVLHPQASSFFQAERLFPSAKMEGCLLKPLRDVVLARQHDMVNGGTKLRKPGYSELPVAVKAVLRR